MIKSRESFHLNPPTQIKEVWMLELASLDEYKSIFKKTEENNKFKLYKFRDEKFGGVSDVKNRDENEEDLDISDITATDLEYDIKGPNILKE